jgi:hypothetical protein
MQANAMRASRHLLALVPGLALGFAVSVGCADRPADNPECFAVSPWEDEYHDAQREYWRTDDIKRFNDVTANFGFCDYGNFEWDDKLGSEYGWLGDPWVERFQYCRPVGSDGTCSRCPPEISDEDIFAQVEQAQRDNECDEERVGVIDYEHGCLIRTLRDDGTDAFDQCCYSAIVVLGCSIIQIPPG